MTVYSKCTKESKYFILEKGEVELHKIKGVNDWLYLTKGYVDNEVYGFVYLYDISEKSFYGEDIEEKKPLEDYWDNYRRNLRKKEYELVKKYQNIKRYGPLLTIKHNNKTLEFWKNFCFPFRESSAKNYLILDYYPNYNEILLLTGYYANSFINIYNLDFQENRCSITEAPFFNQSRTNMISIDRDFGSNSKLVIYEIKDGSYKLIKKIDLDDGPDNPTNIVNVEWLSDKEAKIILDKIDSMHIKINNEVEILR